MSVNKIFLGGVVSEQPVVVQEPNYGKAVQIVLDIHLPEIPRMECVTCYVVDELMANEFLSDVKVGEFVMCQARLSSTNYRLSQEMYCSNCDYGEEQTRRLSDGFDIIVDQYESFGQIPIEQTNGINKVILYGKVKHQPVLTLNEGDLTLAYTQVNMSLDRPDFVKAELSGNPEMGSHLGHHDYVTVCGYGKIGWDLNQFSKVNHMLTIEGTVDEFIGSKNVEIHCRNCGERSNSFMQYLDRRIVVQDIHPSICVLADKEKEFHDLQTNTRAFVRQKQAYDNLQQYDPFDFYPMYES